MNKKLISFILTIALLLGSVSAAFATTETSVTNGDGTEGSIVVEGIVAGGRSASDTVEGTSGTASEETIGSLKADDPNKVVKTARIVGTLKEGEEEIGVATVGRKTYYVIGGLELAENEDTVFSIKLEGRQQLAEGVYLCESEETSLEDSARRYLEFCKQPPKCFAKEFANDYNNYVAKYGDDEDAILSAIMEENGPNAYHSQNYIGYFSGVSAVDVSMQLSLNFVVDEATITSVHEFQTVVPERKPVVSGETVAEDEEAAAGTIEELVDEVPGIPPEGFTEDIEDPETPLVEAPVIADPGEEADAALSAPAADEEFGELPEDPVPLAEVPPTGENSIWAVVAIVSACLMMVWTFFWKRRTE